MKIATPSPEQFQQFLALADTEFRRPGVPTAIWQDNPLLLGDDNRSRCLVVLEKDEVVAGVACLVRQFATSAGAVPVGALGAVVTGAGYRGRGFSRRLQEAALERMQASQVPLAVLWTDRPDLYAGRGFRPAGWEFHLDLAPAAGLGKLPEGHTLRPFADQDAEILGTLYDRHRYRTGRHPGDGARLYGMPGTRGLVVAGEGGRPVAWAFCGKGSDFPDFVLEWGGPQGLVTALLGEVRRRGLARFVLAPAGTEQLADRLVGLGAVATAQPSGVWKVIQPEPLAAYLQAAGIGAPADPADPAAILGSVDEQGVVQPGALALAVWGFDSV